MEEEVVVELDKWQKLNFCSKVKYIINYITVEPCLHFSTCQVLSATLPRKTSTYRNHLGINFNMSEGIGSALEKRNKTNYVHS